MRDSSARHGSRGIEQGEQSGLGLMEEEEKHHCWWQAKHRRMTPGLYLNYFYLIKISNISCR